MTPADMQSIADVLPEGWQPGDHCQDCGKLILKHRALGLACPSINCLITHDGEHDRGANCWAKTTYTHDPQEAAARRVGKIMAPGTDANGSPV